MGCGQHSKTKGGGKRLKKPKAWQHTEPITSEQLARMREEFWDTIHYYGGHKEIWEALRAAAEADDLEFSESIVEGAGIIVIGNDLSKCYDETGALYELPNFVLSEPTNLIQNSQPSRQPDSQSEGQSSNQPVLSEPTNIIQDSESGKQPDNQPEGQSSNQPVTNEPTYLIQNNQPNRQPDSQPEGESSNQPV